MIIETIEEKLKRYAELKQEEKRVVEEIDTLSPDIKEYLSNRGVDKLPTSLGTFSLVSRAVWKYSPAVEKLQKEEKAKGIAKKIESISLMFKTPRAKGDRDDE